ncbi:DUF6415 family natural product biosynthesis protein [Streptomyces sp. NPDC005538]|uniref:DUF6415 family natural product biosynthesis protein n=1 Tax=unclassified Streptomyces TaxID=2593676 RepID=UPI0033AE9744
MISDAVEMRGAYGMRLAAAGVVWDVVKVRQYLAVRTIERIAEPGAVAVDPTPTEPALYFFVPAGSAADWEVPQTTALGLDSHVVLPPDHKGAPPGPYWLISRQRGLTSAAILRQALEQTMSCALTQKGQHPLDVGAMRTTAAEFIGEEEVLPSWETVQTLAHLYRGHVTLLMPAVEALAAQQPNDDVRAQVARVGVGEARRRLDEIEARDLVGEVKRVQRLGRSVLALCDHFETLTGQPMCLACDRPINDDDESVPYGQVSPSGGAVAAGRIHATCGNTVRRR